MSTDSTAMAQVCVAQAVEKLRNRFSSLKIKEFRGDNMLTVSAGTLLPVMRYAKEACGFDMLLCVSGVDRMGQNPRFEVHYTITGSETGATLLVCCTVADSATPSVPSLVELWRSANWLEREQFDLMGIHFEGHPDLRRILMWDEYPYHPLRKDFPVAGVELEDVGGVFTQKAPTQGAPFTTAAGGRTAADREPHSRE